MGMIYKKGKGLDDLNKFRVLSKEQLLGSLFYVDYNIHYTKCSF